MVYSSDAPFYALSSKNPIFVAAAARMGAALLTQKWTSNVRRLSFLLGSLLMVAAAIPEAAKGVPSDDSGLSNLGPSKAGPSDAEAPLSIQSMNVADGPHVPFERVTVTFRLSEPVSDEEAYPDIRAGATVTRPNGETFDIPAFYNRKFEIDHDAHRVSQTGSGEWTIRFTPHADGQFSVRAYIHHFDDTAHSRRVSVTVDADGTTKRGFIRIHPHNSSYFAYTETGETHFPLGFNLDIPAFTRDGNGHLQPNSRYHGIYGDDTFRPIISQEKALYELYNLYIDGITRLAKNGGTSIRLRLDSWWLPLEIASDYPVPGYPNGVPGFSVGRYHAGHAWLADQVISLAESLGLSVILVTWNGNSDWTRRYPRRSNRMLVHRRLRYQVARWGYSTSLLAWELFNEGPSLDQGIRQRFWTDVISWLRSIDPYDHLVTNSNLGVDYRERHKYVGRDESFLTGSNFSKECCSPLLLSEFGERRYFKADVNQDATGARARIGIWSSIVNQYAGAMYWWYYPHIRPLNLYQDVFSDARAFLEGQDLGTQNWKKAIIRPQSQSDPRTYRGMIGNQSTGLLLVAGPTGSGDSALSSLPPTSIDVGGINPGVYRIEWWNTNSNGRFRETTAFSDNNTLQVSIPQIKDQLMAVRLSRLRPKMGEEDDASRACEVIVYPNPAQSYVQLSLRVSKTQMVDIHLHDVLGRRVRAPMQKQMQRGRLESTVMGLETLQSGTYFLRIRGQSFTRTKTLMIAR